MFVFFKIFLLPTVDVDPKACCPNIAHFPHARSRSRAYRWGEDTIAGISGNHQCVCLGLSLWNGEDPAILKERLCLYHLTNHQGNHGEDVKEVCCYLDCTPTHWYMKFLYTSILNAHCPPESDLNPNNFFAEFVLGLNLYP